MKTPIYSFLKKYSASDTVRLHMPGHKGNGPLGVEALDITEVRGADSLFEADGIIKESESVASEIFGAHTFYSTEGSSLSIRAMVYLTALYARALGRAPKIVSARNCHRSFLSALALVDLEVDWLDSAGEGSYLTAGDVRGAFADYLGRTPTECLPIALYLTSPDYLGNMQDIGALATLCHERGMLLLVDNAHGAYLKLLEKSLHPVDLGADICADSAHKTLEALTGAGYLHISKNAPVMLAENAKRAMSVFASTSPSYLILASLDLLNEKLLGSYRDELRDFIRKLDICKEMITNKGVKLVGDEPMKITLLPKSIGYSGNMLADVLRERGIECEFSDEDFVTLMPTPSSRADITVATEVILGLKPRARKNSEVSAPVLRKKPERVMSVREAILSVPERVPVKQALGRVVCDTALACPPAVPILMPGERVGYDAVAVLEYYGIDSLLAVRE